MLEGASRRRFAKCQQQRPVRRNTSQLRSTCRSHELQHGNGLADEAEVEVAPPERVESRGQKACCVGVKPNEEDSRTRLVNDIEMAGLIKFCRENKHLDDESPRKGSDAGLRVALAAHLAHLTRKAQGEILRLHKSQIGDDGITFGKRKRGAPTMVLWTPALRETMDECLALPNKCTSKHLIHNRYGLPYTSSGFKSMRKRIMNKWVAEGNEYFTFHDIRAKSATDLIEEGRKASELTGHLTESIPAKVYDRRVVRKAKAVR